MGGENEDRGVYEGVPTADKAGAGGEPRVFGSGEGEAGAVHGGNVVREGGEGGAGADRQERGLREEGGLDGGDGDADVGVRGNLICESERRK